MKVTNCEHPRLVFNKYLNRKVLVSCGKCNICKQERRNRWVSRMINEAKAWKFVRVIHLDYNDDMIPTYQLEEEHLVEQQSRFYTNKNLKQQYEHNWLPVADFEELLIGKNEYESNYFYTRLYDYDRGINHVDIRDIQRFCKRLNTYIKREVTGHYHNFRYAIAAEYGETTFRAHYHGIIYFNDPRIADNFERLLVKSWTDGNLVPLGHAYSEADRGHAASYISKYIVKPADIPICYSHSRLSTFFTCSRRPPLGVFDKPIEEIQGLFDSGACERVTTKNVEGITRLAVLPVSGTFENHLFPKCPLYSVLPSWLRTRLIRFAAESESLSHFVLDILKEFYNCVPLVDIESRDWFDAIPNFPRFVNLYSDVAKIVDVMTEGMTKLHFIYSLYYCGRNVYYLSQIFHKSLDDTILCIDRHYQKKELYNLGLFYRLQDDLIKQKLVDDIAVFYPYNHMDETQALRFPPKSVNDCKASQLIIEESHITEKMALQQNIKSAYLDGKRETDPVLFNFIKDFFYGKKCDENAQAIANAWS